MRTSPWLAFGLLVFACLGFLCYAQYRTDPEDTVWNDADIPPPIAAMTPVPGSLAPGTAPMLCSDPFRHRKYAPSLLDAKFSIIGTF